MNDTSSRGYEGAQHTPVGATVTRVYFCEPGDYTPAADNAEYDTYEAALDAAIARHEAAERRHREHYVSLSTGRGEYRPLPERFSIDCRWTMTWAADPAHGVHTTGTDTVMNRTTYETLDAGREHLARIRKFTYVPTLRDGSEYRPGEQA